MKYYLAPLEGITSYIYRNTISEVFGSPDRLFTPFLSPNENRAMNTRERMEVLPDHNRGIEVIPQILTNRADYFLSTTKEIADMGYTEVNLNLGCPSGTVVAKKRGSGFLSEKDALERFLDEIYSRSPIPISIKTRLGIHEPEEFYEIMKLYEKFPISELIIHPRVQKDFYKNSPRMEVFGEAIKGSKLSICYNGDLFTVDDVNRFKKDYTTVEKVMIGRGALMNPSFIRGLMGGSAVPTTEELMQFHDLLVERYYNRMADDKNVMFKMKELWFYMIRIFEGSEKYGKKIRKTQKLAEYREIVSMLFRECPIVVPEKISI